MRYVKDDVMIAAFHFGKGSSYAANRMEFL